MDNDCSINFFRFFLITILWSANSLCRKRFFSLTDLNNFVYFDETHSINTEKKINVYVVWFSARFKKREIEKDRRKKFATTKKIIYYRFYIFNLPTNDLLHTLNLTFTFRSIQFGDVLRLNTLAARHTEKKMVVVGTFLIFFLWSACRSWCSCVHRRRW